MGFEYVPSTAGSSVRFDPPSGTDRVRVIFILRFVAASLSFVSSSRPSISTNVSVRSLYSRHL